jgi:hypothetical protein
MQEKKLIKKSLKLLNSIMPTVHKWRHFRR